MEMEKIANFEMVVYDRNASLHGKVVDLIDDSSDDEYTVNVDEKLHEVVT